jgi:hypothetical protein
MAKSKYSIVKGKTGKSKKVVVAGKKKVLYKKEGSSAMYVLSKGRHMKLSAYKKMKMKGGNQEGGGRKKGKRGGMSDLNEQFNSLLHGGAKKKRKRKGKGKGKKKK